MEELKIKGKINKIYPKESGTSRAGNAWTKQGFTVITTDGQYEKENYFSAMKDTVLSQLAAAGRGAEVEVSFNLSSRNYTDKDGKVRWSVDLLAWRIWADRRGETSKVAEPAAPAVEEVYDDDLPF